MWRTKNSIGTTTKLAKSYSNIKPIDSTILIQLAKRMLVLV
ncbi:hypothetical protein [uncultured Clostridium sp.]|nr:hypothetical protein [uncultured Clostridium sp.]